MTATTEVKLYYDMNGLEFMQKIEAEKDVVVLDVRTPAEFEAGKIPGAINLDVLTLNFFDSLSKLDKSKQYLVYCRSGSRSINACVMMGSKGFRTYHLAGGIFNWPGQVVK